MGYRTTPRSHLDLTPSRSEILLSEEGHRLEHDFERHQLLHFASAPHALPQGSAEQRPREMASIFNIQQDLNLGFVQQWIDELSKSAPFQNKERFVARTCVRPKSLFILPEHYTLVTEYHVIMN
jgi:hypothetical protein